MIHCVYDNQSCSHISGNTKIADIGSTNCTPTNLLTSFSASSAIAVVVRLRWRLFRDWQMIERANGRRLQPAGGSCNFFHWFPPPLSFAVLLFTLVTVCPPLTLLYFDPVNALFRPVANTNWYNSWIAGSLPEIALIIGNLAT